MADFEQVQAESGGPAATRCRSLPSAAEAADYLGCAIDGATVGIGGSVTLQRDGTL